MLNREAIEKLECFPGWNLDDEWLAADEMQDLTEIAISALEKQTPKKPVKSNMATICLECSHSIKRCYDFCPGCGQAIDWH